MTVNQFSCFLIGEGTLPIQCAELLLERGHQILGIISPDLLISNWAKKKHISYIQPTDNLLAFLSKQPFDYLFSIVNTAVLPEKILELPRQESINFIDAPLPKYAGANATSWALIHQEKTHGVTWHKMCKIINGGDILKQVSFDIAENETAFTLNGKCYKAGIHSFAQLIDELSSCKAVAIKQNLNERTYLPPSKRPGAGGLLKFNCCAYEIEALVRALDFGPYPNSIGLAKLVIKDKFIVVSQLEVLDELSEFSPGTIIGIEPGFLKVSTSSYNIALNQVKTLDGEALSVLDLVKQFKLQVGYQFKNIESKQTQHIEEFNTLITKHETFWVERLVNLQPMTIPYTDQKVLHLKQKRFESVNMFLPDKVISFWRERHPAWDLGDFLLAAFVCYLARLSRTNCFDIGFRDIKLVGELGAIPGFFATYVPCRLEINFEQSFEELFEAVREQVELTVKNKTYSLDALARYPILRSLPKIGGEPIFPVVIERGKILNEQPPAPGNELTFVIPENGEECYWLYNVDVLDDDSIARMVEQFSIFLQGIVSNSSQSIAYLPLLSKQELHKILVEWNNLQANHPKDKCIHQLFEEQVERIPDAVAVVLEDQQLSYRELNTRANQLAHYLQNLGVKPEIPVGIYMDFSLDLAVAVFGILKAGGVCLPFDVEFPKERVAFMLEDTQAPIILTQQHLLSCIPQDNVQIVFLDKSWKTIARESTELLFSGVTLNNLAYIHYTSGSTGKPKGVMRPHRSCVRESTVKLTETDRHLLQDSSLEELFWPLRFGGTGIMVRPGGHKDSAYLVKLIAEQEITVAIIPPSMLKVLLEEPEIKTCMSLRYVFSSGEALTTKLREDFLNHLAADLRNDYGTTETSYATLGTSPRVGKHENNLRSHVLVGPPASDRQIYILDSHLQPVPIGVPGEVYIGGEGLARGYLNRPDLTKEKFVPNPFSNFRLGTTTKNLESSENFVSTNKSENPTFTSQNSQSNCLYKSGDLARYLSDGNIEFLGRLDNQVKIRGFRIEPGEIEAATIQHPGVYQTVVTSSVDNLGDKCLVSYIVPRQKLAPSKDELRHFLKQKLPDYMVPRAFVFLDNLPLTPNGKIDRLALPAPDLTRQKQEEPFVAPRNQLEIQLIKVWEKVLGIQPIGVRDNFFALGGHSLLAVRLLAQIEKILGKNLPLTTLFQAPTVEQLASFFHREKRSVPCSLIHVTPPSGSKRPLFWCGLGFAELAKYLGVEQPIYGLPGGFYEIQDAATHIKEWATGYVDEIRAVQPEGPYLLGGYCWTGFIAFEIAQQLQAQGQKVALLALVERDSPDSIYRLYQKIDDSFRFHRRNLAQLSPAEQLTYVFKRLMKRVETLIMPRFNRRNAADEKFVLTHDSKANALKQAGLAEQSYVSQQVYSGRVALFFSAMSKHPSFFFPRYGWGKLVTGELDFYVLPGNHLAVVKEPYVQILAEKLRICLDKAQADD